MNTHYSQIKFFPPHFSFSFFLLSFSFHAGTRWHMQNFLLKPLLYDEWKMSVHGVLCKRANVTNHLLQEKIRACYTPANPANRQIHSTVRIHFLLFCNKSGDFLLLLFKFEARLKPRATNHFLNLTTLFFCLNLTQCHRSFSKLNFTKHQCLFCD